MTPFQFFKLVCLSAIWGSSFLFTRIAAPEFGPFALIEFRMIVATLVLAPILLMRVPRAEFSRERWRVLLLGICNTAIPFSMFAYATVRLGAGTSSVLNSTVPFFSALIAWLWTGEKVTSGQSLGLALGTVGVLILSWGKLSWLPGGNGLAFVAALGAAVLYAFSANFTRRHLSKVRPLVITVFSQISAGVFLIPFALARMPAGTPSGHAWMAALALGLMCTGIAYVMFFKLVEEVGATRTITLTFLLPVFGILWGSIFLGEKVSGQMALGTAVILAGTALATGLVKARRS